MKASTVAALERINRIFYERLAVEFSATRTQPWPGWQRVFELVAARRSGQRLSILDLGCGNGRLLQPLESFFGNEIHYLGVDSSVPLLAAARGASTREGEGEGSTSRPRWVAVNLVDEPLEEIHKSGRFDLIVAFGLMHHLPSLALRRRLVASAVDRLRPGGLLAVSFWQFATKDRFRRRFVPWLQYSSDLSERPEALDVSDLEPGDHLVAWGDAGAVRYCHFADADEAELVVNAPNVAVIDSFQDDGATGDLNLYHVLEKSR